jgi:hypothetical protein
MWSYNYLLRCILASNVVSDYARSLVLETKDIPHDGTTPDRPPAPGEEPLSMELCEMNFHIL